MGWRTPSAPSNYPRTPPMSRRNRRPAGSQAAAAQGADEVQQAGDGVAGLTFLPWHRGSSGPQAAYLSHNQGMGRLPEPGDPKAVTLFGDDNRIEPTWVNAQAPSPPDFRCRPCRCCGRPDDSCSSTRTNPPMTGRRGSLPERTPGPHNPSTVTTRPIRGHGGLQPEHQADQGGLDRDPGHQHRAGRRGCRRGTVCVQSRPTNRRRSWGCDPGPGGQKPPKVNRPAKSGSANRISRAGRHRSDTKVPNQAPTAVMPVRPATSARHQIGRWPKVTGG